MIIFTNPDEWKTLKKSFFKPYSKVGFVPTMGALHEGHKSLINRAKSENDVCLTSVFVNPTQFNAAEDLTNYPRTLQSDIDAAASAGCHALYLPSVKTMYGDSVKSDPISYGPITDTLEGEFRPGHFNGVITIVRKLLEHTAPDQLYLGEKDFQQLAVIRELVRREGIRTEVVGCDLVRDHDGMALSSRNVRLSASGRQTALAGYQTLVEMKRRTAELNPTKLSQWGRRHLEQQPGVTLEYLEIVYDDDLSRADHWDTARETRILLAFYVEGVRLIDNLPIHG